MKPKKQKILLKTKLLALLGGLIILVIAAAVSYEFYLYGIENNVYTNNYTTSVLFSDSLTTATGAAPLALFSLNFFICRVAIKKWYRYLKRRLG